MYTTEGIILKRSDAGEVGSLFTIYTKDFGKIRALAQGVKKEGAKLKGHLEPLSLSSISFVLGKNGERLTHAAMLNYWFSIRENHDKLSAAYIISELVDTQCFPGQKDERLWELLLGSFLALETSEFRESEISKFLQKFREKFVAALGYAGVSDMAFLRYNHRYG